jgi:hypothetical protein
METRGGCISAVSLRSASNRHCYTAVVLRLRGVSDVPRQLAPFSGVGKLRGLSGLNNEQQLGTLYRLDRQHAAAAVHLSLAAAFAHDAATHPPSYITHSLALT